MDEMKLECAIYGDANLFIRDGGEHTIKFDIRDDHEGENRGRFVYLTFFQTKQLIEHLKKQLEEQGNESVTLENKCVHVYLYTGVYPDKNDSKLYDEYECRDCGKVLKLESK